MEKHKGTCKHITVSMPREGISVKKTCLSEERRSIMQKIVTERKAAFDALAKY
jgi:hypothetical protein